MIITTIFMIMIIIIIVIFGCQPYILVDRIIHTVTNTKSRNYNYVLKKKILISKKYFFARIKKNYFFGWINENFFKIKIFFFSVAIVIIVTNTKQFSSFSEYIWIFMDFSQRQFMRNIRFEYVKEVYKNINNIWKYLHNKKKRNRACKLII